MFGWFKRKDDGFNVYKPSEMLLYSYWNGSKFVKADPLTLYKAVMQVGPDLAIDMKVADSQSKDNITAHNKLIGRIRQIFAIAPVEQGGLTETATRELLDHFLLYCDEVKKKQNPLPMSSNNSEASSPTSEPSGQPMPSGSDSGCAEKESCCDEAESLPSDAASPSAPILEKPIGVP